MSKASITCRAGLRSVHVSLFQGVIIVIIVQCSYNYSQSHVIVARLKLKFQPDPLARVPRVGAVKSLHRDHAHADVSRKHNTGRL